MYYFSKLILLLCTLLFGFEVNAATLYRLPLVYIPYPINAWYDHATSGTSNLRYDGITIASGSPYWYDPSPSRHHGTDFGVSTGTPVYASAGGTVVYVRSSCIVGVLTSPDCDGFGNHVRIRHSTASDGYAKVSIYAHLSTLSVTNGATVSCGQLIGYSGNTGYSSGPHLHFELWQNESIGNRMDPFGGAYSTQSWDYWYDWAWVADPLRSGYNMKYPVTTCQP